jgi:hypothetical protein
VLAATEAGARSGRPTMAGSVRGEAGGGRRLRGSVGVGRKKTVVLGFKLLGWWVIIGIYGSFAC